MMKPYNPEQAHRVIELAESRVIDLRTMFNHYVDEHGTYPPAEWWVNGKKGQTIRDAQDFLEALYSIILAEKERQGLEGLRNVRTDREQKSAERSALRKAERRDWWLETHSQEDSTID